VVSQAQALARRRFFAALLVTAALQAAACDVAFSGFREQETDTWSKSFPISATGRLEIVNTNGEIDVSVGEGSTIEVQAVRVARAASVEAAKELLAKAVIRDEVTPDHVKLFVERPRGGFGRGGIEVRYTVKVPRGAAVTLQNTNGRIAVAGVGGEARLSTTNGEISARDLGGRVDASTTNGEIEIELAAVSAPVEAETTNGGVRIRIPQDAKASLSASCTNGGIDVEGLNVETVDKTRRRLEARLNGGGTRIDASTTNGGITFARR
jgi:DUF4097 and DUF4098 domain-containing protein YvlB